MKRIFLSLALAGLVYSATAQPAMAHWGRWSCGSYYSGYTYYYPRYYYYPSYNSCSNYYGSNYGSYYNGYVPYPTYGYNSGFSNLGFGGNNLLGLLAGSGLAGANLSGSLLQPSYLSMPVSVGYGNSGFLQIPMGNPAGRATYLQIPVNTGYGPSSYLQIELGRNSGTSTLDAPVPTTPNPNTTPNIPPFGSLPGSTVSPTSQYTLDTPKTPSDEIPTALAPAKSEPTASIAFSLLAPAPAPSSTTSEQDAGSDPTVDSHGIQFVSLTRQPESPPKLAPAATSPPKDTSFSLTTPSSRDKPTAPPDPDQSTWQKMALSSTHEDLPWQAK